MTLPEKLSALRTSLHGLDRAIVAFSGGVDSTFLLAETVDALGDRCEAVTARSASLPALEAVAATALAARLGARHRFVDTTEVADPRYAENTPDRCYFCKQELFTQMAALAATAGGATLLYGAIADDALEYRPGGRAAGEAAARAPLAEHGFTKADVRAASHARGLPTADKPASACLSSRIPHGTPVTPELLGRIERAEAALHRLGFRDCRVRHHGDVARIEVPPADLPRLLAARDTAIPAVRNAGWRWVTLDLDGYRPSGSLRAPD